MQTIKRVQTLYSYKKPDGSLYLRGVYSVDSPVGIPDMIMQDAINGRKTVRVLEYGNEEIKKEIEPEPEEIKEIEPEEIKEIEPETKSEEEEIEEEVKEVLPKLKKKVVEEKPVKRTVRKVRKKKE